MGVRTAVGVSQQKGDERVGAPRVRDDTGPEAQGDQTGERPDILQHGKVGSLVVLLREASHDEEADDVEESLLGSQPLLARNQRVGRTYRGNCQQVGHKGVESQ